MCVNSCKEFDLVVVRIYLIYIACWFHLWCCFCGIWPFATYMRPPLLLGHYNQRPTIIATIIIFINMSRLWIYMGAYVMQEMRHRGNPPSFSSLLLYPVCPWHLTRNQDLQWKGSNVLAMPVLWMDVFRAQLQYNIKSNGLETKNWLIRVSCEKMRKCNNHSCEFYTHTDTFYIPAKMCTIWHPQYVQFTASQFIATSLFFEQMLCEKREHIIRLTQ